MKLKEILFGLGFKPPLREYSFDLDSFVQALRLEIVQHVPDEKARKKIDRPVRDRNIHGGTPPHQQL